MTDTRSAKGILIAALQWCGWNLEDAEKVLAQHIAESAPKVEAAMAEAPPASVPAPVFHPDAGVVGDVGDAGDIGTNAIDHPSRIAPEAAPETK